jgi:hypothetical protein
MLVRILSGDRVVAGPPGQRESWSAADRRVSADERAAWQVINAFMEQAAADGVITPDESRAILSVTYQQMPAAETAVRNRLRPVPQATRSAETVFPHDRVPSESFTAPPIGGPNQPPAPPVTAISAGDVAPTPGRNRATLQVMLGRPTPVAADTSSVTPFASPTPTPPAMRSTMRLHAPPDVRVSPPPPLAYDPPSTQPSAPPHLWSEQPNLPPGYLFPDSAGLMDSCPSGDPFDTSDEYAGLKYSGYWFGAVEAYRGEPDCRWPANFGTRLGGNFALPLWSSQGLGGQFGLSYGTFDWHGRGSTATDTAGWAEELIWSVGVFQRASPCDLDCGLPVSWGISYDWMRTDNFGLDSNEVLLTQWRAQAEYALSACDAVGVWATLHDRGDGQGNIIIGHSHLESLDQINAFWRHKLESDAEFRVWAGAAADPGEFSVGGELNIPLSCHFAAFMAAHYIKPSASGGDGLGWHDEYYMLTAGISYFPGGTAFSDTVFGRRWMPYLLVPDNGSFAARTDASK